MKKSEMEKPEITALLITLRKELISIFEQFSKIVRLKESRQRQKRILNDLKYLITKELKADPDDKNIYDIFNQ